MDIHVLKTHVSFNRNHRFLEVPPKKGELMKGLALPEDHEDSRLSIPKNLGSERIKWRMGIKDASELGSFMDLVEADHDMN